jgi:hypothetical protein
MVSNAEYLRKALFGPFDADPCLADILRRSAEAGFDQHFFCPTTHNAEMTQIHITCWLDKVDLVCPDTLVHRILHGDSLHDGPDYYAALKITRDAALRFNEVLDPLENICWAWEPLFPGFFQRAYPQRFKHYSPTELLTLLAWTVPQQR